jgi:outer membrane cobalamin receptor
MDTVEPGLSVWGPSGRVGVSYAFTDELVLHAFGGYLWQPPPELDGAVAARILVPSLAGQAVPVDLKPETDWAGEVGIAGRIARRVSWGTTGWGRYAYDQLDRQNVGTTNLIASYNYARGRAIGAEAWSNFAFVRVLDGFVNGGWQVAQGRGVDSERYLFTAAELANTGWGTLDHAQTWTANVGFDLHDERGKTHFSGLMRYGSGLRTGPTVQLHVPEHTTLDLTLRHHFDVPLPSEVAFDVMNVFDDVYAYRIATGFVGSAYAPLRRADVRLKVPF